MFFDPIGSDKKQLNTTNKAANNVRREPKTIPMNRHDDDDDTTAYDQNGTTMFWKASKFLVKPYSLHFAFAKMLFYRVCSHAKYISMKTCTHSIFNSQNTMDYTQTITFSTEIFAHHCQKSHQYM